MESKLFKNWWLLAVNGIIAILVGILLLFTTPEFINTIVRIIGLVVLVGGVVLLITALYYLKKDRSVLMMMIQSVASITIGLIILIFPESSLKWFLILIGVWAVIVGLFQLVILINLGKNLANRNLILLNGLLTIALGVVLILYPVEFAGVIVKVLGIAAALFGAVMIYLGFAVRKISQIPEKKQEPPAPAGGS